MAQENPGVKQESNPRERFQRNRRSTKTPRAASPTRTIEPGIVHYRIAQGLLEGMKAKAAERGFPLDVGEFPEITDVPTDGEDPQKLANLVAHMVARVGDRFSFLRRVSRHLEGSEKRAGILSDFVAAAYALYKRNPDLLEKAGAEFAEELQRRRALQRLQREQQNAPRNGASQPQSEGVPNAA